MDPERLNRPAPHHPGDPPLSAPQTDRQRAAREAFAQWMNDHPDFSSRELLTHWQDLRKLWGLTHDPDHPYPPPGHLSGPSEGRGGEVVYPLPEEPSHDGPEPDDEPGRYDSGPGG